MINTQTLEKDKERYTNQIKMCMYMYILYKLYMYTCVNSAASVAFKIYIIMQSVHCTSYYVFESHLVQLRMKLLVYNSLSLLSIVNSVNYTCSCV